MIEINNNRVYSENKLIGYAAFINSTGICKLHLNTDILPAIIKIDGKEYETITGPATHIYKTDSRYKFTHDLVKIKVPEGERVYNKELTFSDLKNIEMSIFERRIALDKKERDLRDKYMEEFKKECEKLYGAERDQIISDCEAEGHDWIVTGYSVGYTAQFERCRKCKLSRSVTIK